MSTTTSRNDVPTSREGKLLLHPVRQKRVQIPKLKAIDFAWIFLVALISIPLHYLPGLAPRAVDHIPLPLANSHIVSLLCCCLIPPVSYIALVKSRDKTAAIIASLLLAGSSYLIRSAHEAPESALLTLLLVSAYAWYAAELNLAASIFLIAASLLRPELCLFTVPFLTAAATRRTKFALPLAALLIVAQAALPAIVDTVLLHHGWYTIFSLEHSHARFPWLIRWATESSFAALWWFVFPFIGEVCTSDGRRKYGPLTIAIILYLLFAVFMIHPFAVQTLLPVTPFLTIVLAIGIARVIPTIAAEVPGVTLRYTVAVLAAGSLVVISLAQQWFHIKHAQAQSPSLSAMVNQAPLGGSASVAAVKSTFQQSVVAPNALSKFNTQGEDYNESRSNGGGRGNAAASTHIQPAEAFSSNPQQAVHAALNRTPQTVRSGGNNSNPLLSRG